MAASGPTRGGGKEAGCWQVVVPWYQVAVSVFVQVAAEEKLFVRNKMAQVFALVFVVDYPLKVINN